MAYKLIAIDIDGTLLTDDKKLPQKNIDAMRAAANAGVEIMMATGRPHKAATWVMEQAGIEGLILSAGGTLACHYPGGETVYEAHLPPELVSEVADYCRENSLFWHCISGTDVYYETVGALSQYTDSYFGFPGKVLDFTSAHGITFNKGNIVLGDESTIDVAKALDDRFGNRVEVLISDKKVIDITPKGVGKGVALLSVAALFGLSKDEVIAIGDTDADISMIQAAGLGVCMENGTPGTIAAADYIAPSNNDCGVAHVIEKFILKYQQDID